MPFNSIISSRCVPLYRVFIYGVPPSFRNVIIMVIRDGHGEILDNKDANGKMENFRGIGLSICGYSFSRSIAERVGEM